VASKIEDMVDQIIALKKSIISPGILDDVIEHLSGDETQAMNGYGFQVVDMNGYKPLKGAGTLPKFRPHFLWSRISWLTQHLIVNRPGKAASLLCAKETSQKIL